jgi:gluconolactonase
MKKLTLVALMCAVAAFAQQGTITQHQWTSKIFPGTVRDYWVYVPAQYNASKPACVMVFQDGGGFVGEKSPWRAPAVFDALIAKGEMPVTIGIFINPGVLPALSATQRERYNRSYEYDALGDRYARFLIEEILPEVGKRYNLSKDPNDRAIAGSSSGGIAAFTAAWTRPDAFRRVLSFIGSYTNLRGGHNYAGLIRKVEPKPLRVYLQDGRNDQNIYGGNWFIANQDMASALEYAGYDTTFVVGDEGHNSKHGAAILPDALRWLWRDYPKPIAASPKVSERHEVRLIIDPSSSWQPATESAPNETGPYHADGNGRIWLRSERVVHEGLRAGSVRLSPDRSLLFASDPASKWVWSFQVQPDGSLANGQTFYRLETSDESDASLARGMTVDTDGYLYVATALGVQICDQAGRVTAILNPPDNAPVTNVFFGGPDRKTLFVTAGDKTFSRRLQRQGVPAGTPVQPPKPRL